VYLELSPQPLNVTVDGSVVHVDVFVMAASIKALRLFTTPGLLASACKMRNSVTVSVTDAFFQVQV
jgi:hypothetical protein